jgi:porphobilinogen synthase
MQHLMARARRNRKNETIRSFHRETWIAPQHFVYPLFLHAGSGTQAIASMPGQVRHDLSSLVDEVGAAREEGVNSVVLFPAVEERLKTPKGDEAKNPEGLIPVAIRKLKEQFPDVVICTDVALDPYNSDGHDGIVAPDGRILNDETIEVLCQQARVQAAAGADVIAPSDMMDGRIGAIRATLDESGFTEVSILSYCAKYASSFYGPFRDALDSAPKAGDKKTYQMDPANVREALREIEADEAEGADLLMVKPAGPYLDVIRFMREATVLPVVAYQVSGEFAMLKAAAANGWLDERATVLESLTAIRRAGADVIFTYFAREAARYLKQG